MTAPGDALLEEIRERGGVPAHIAVIMDGNERWAQSRGLPRPAGHQAGMAAVRELVEGGLQAGEEGRHDHRRPLQGVGKTAKPTTAREK